MRATFAGGKEKWKSLRTAHYSVAKARLGEFLREHGEKTGVRIQRVIREDDIRSSAPDPLAKSGGRFAAGFA